MSIGVLGDVTFEVKDGKVLTWSRMRRRAAARWQEHAVLQAKPVREFVGPGLESVTLSVRLDINLGVDPATQLKTLRGHRDEGDVLQFTVGSELIGDFNVDSVEEEWRTFARDGSLVVVQVELELGEYQ